MRKFIIAIVSAGVVFFFSIDTTRGPVATPAPIAEPPASLIDQTIITSKLDGVNASDQPQVLAKTSSLIKIHSVTDENPSSQIASEAEVDLPGSAAERVAELERLAELNTAQLYSVLWQSIESEMLDDDGFLEFILATLETRGDSNPGGVLAALVQNAPTPTLRRMALSLLSEACQELSTDSFRLALTDPDPATRQFALSYFDSMNAKAMFEAVASAVLDEDRAVRLAAFSTLEAMHQFSPIWQVAESVLNDPDPQVRMRALEMLSYGGREVATPQLILALNDPDPNISKLAEDLLTGLTEGPY